MCESIKGRGAEIRECPVCSTKFRAHPSSKQIYCSRDCGRIGMRKPRITKQCETCGNDFEIDLYRENIREHKYCSQKCWYEAQRKTRLRKNCKECGKEFEVIPSHSHQLFCSKECVDNNKRKRWENTPHPSKGVRTGQKHKSFKGEIREKQNNGIVDKLIYLPDHPRAGKGARIPLHRHLVEEEQFKNQTYDSRYFDNIDGKPYLKKGIDVHHIDLNHENNEISNLTPLTRSEHLTLHNKLKAEMAPPKPEKKRIVQTKNNTTGYRGVMKRPTGDMYYSIINYNKTKYFLGGSKDSELLAKVYDKAALYFYKEGAALNFPDIDYSKIRLRDLLPPLITKSIFRGVKKKKDGKWESNIRTREKREYLGSFCDEVEAAKAYDKRAYELKGNKATLNFPEDYGLTPQEKSVNIYDLID